MSNPPPPGGWQDPPAPGQQSTPPADPTLPLAGGQIPAQPGPANPYAATGYPPPTADPYAAAGYPPPTADPYTAAGYPPPAHPGYGYPAAGYPAGYPAAGYPVAARTNTMAVVALVLSLVGFLSCITAPVGAILGHVARKQIRETGEQGEGMATAAIVIGWILTGLLVLLAGFYVVAIVFAITSTSTGG